MFKRKIFVILGLAVLLSLSATWIGMEQSQIPDFDLAYQKLCSWDCLLYAEIAENGYHFTLPPLAHWHSNVSFFPSFPLAARALHLTTGLSAKTSVLLVSQGFTLVFWSFFFLLMDLWRIDLLLTAALAVGVFAQPASFFLVTGYSESMFLSGLLAMIYFYEKKQSMASGVSAFVMSASRIVGLPLALYPLVAEICENGWKLNQWRKRPCSSPLIASAIGMLGAALFFFYCYLQWGYADLYMQNQKEGWGIVPDYLAIFHWRTFHFGTAYDQWSTYSMPVFLFLFGGAEALAYFRFKNRGISKRLPLYFCILAMDYINISGLVVRWFYSMVRYVLPCAVLFGLCAAHLSKAFPKIPRLASIMLLAFWLLAMSVFFYYVQLPHYFDYMRGTWFA